MKMINENDNVNDTVVVKILRLSAQFLLLFFFYEKMLSINKII